MDAQEYANALATQFDLLIALARRTNELDLWGCVNDEMRGMRDAGWSTAITAREVFEELHTLGNAGRRLERHEVRQVLCLYMQLSEAGGVYEGLRSMMAIAKLKPYSMWPFHDLVQRRGNPRRAIGPNANAMFKALASEARDIGMVKLSELLEIAFRDDIRNGIAHADYILWDDGLRLPQRNGGLGNVLTHEQMVEAVRIALLFFEILHLAKTEIATSFQPAREIYGRFSTNPPMAWRCELAEDGSYSISSDAALPTAETIAAYERQARINDRLGGKFFAIYATQVDAPVTALIDHMAAEGFEAAVVELPQDQMTALEAEIQDNNLWDARAEVAQQGVMLASPFGFRRITEANQFASVLPELPDEPDDAAEDPAPPAVPPEGA